MINEEQQKSLPGAFAGNCIQKKKYEFELAWIIFLKQK